MSHIDNLAVTSQLNVVHTELVVDLDTEERKCMVCSKILPLRLFNESPSPNVANRGRKFICVACDDDKPHFSLQI